MATQHPADQFLDHWQHQKLYPVLEQSGTQVSCELRVKGEYACEICLQRINDSTIKLASISTREDLRGQGIGSWLLGAVCDTADTCGVALTLEPSTFAQGISIFETDEDLRRWYHRRGFEYHDQRTMRRPIRPSVGGIRTQPVDFVVVVNEQSFVVRLVTEEQIATARKRRAGEEKQGIVSGSLADGDGGFNRDIISENKRWTWHLIPETVKFPTFAIEVCDGRPSDVEANKQHWLNDIGMYCPLGATFKEELRASSSQTRVE